MVGAWRLRDLVHFADLGELHDCCRAPLARRAGIKTAIALPIMRDGQVIGTLDFFAIQSVEVSQARLAALRTIGQLASDKVSKLAKQSDLNRIKQMVENAPVNLLYADLDLKVQYMNRKAAETLKRLEAHLPIKVSPDDRPLDRCFPQGPRAPAADSGRPSEPAANGNDQRRP